MPTYDYECQACGHTFEEFQSITASPLRKCPVCKKMKLNRLIGAGAGVIFKGSGFYCTDYRSSDYKAKAKSDSSSASTSSKPASTAKSKASATSNSKGSP